MCYSKIARLGTFIFVLALSVFAQESRAQNILDLNELKQWVYDGVTGADLPEGNCEVLAGALNRNRQGKWEQDINVNFSFADSSIRPRETKLRIFPSRPFVFADSCDDREKLCRYEFRVVVVGEDGSAVENPERPLKLSFISPVNEQSRFMSTILSYKVLTGPNHGKWVDFEACVELERSER